MIITRFIKLTAFAGIILGGCGVSLLHADTSPAPVVVSLPFVLETDSNPVTTKARLSIPVISIDKDRDAFMQGASGDADDAAFVGYLKALKAGDNAARSKYLAMDGDLKPQATISGLETTSFFPADANLHILGKIPLETGAAYIIVTRSKDRPPNVFLTSVVGEGGKDPKVYLMNPWPFLSVLSNSFSQANLGTLLKDGSPGKPGQVLTRQEVTDFLLSRTNPSAVGDILKTIDSFQKNSGKDSFTTGGTDGMSSSQQDFDKSFADLDTANQAKWIQQESAAARNIAYILDFDPLFVTVQKGGGKPDTVSSKDYQQFVEGDDATFYYLRGKDGKLRLTNWQLDDEFNTTIRALPAPPAAVTQACDTAIKAVGSSH